MYILYPNVRLLVIVLHVWCPRGPRLFTYYVSCIGAIIYGVRARAHPVSKNHALMERVRSIWSRALYSGARAL